MSRCLPNTQLSLFAPEHFFFIWQNFCDNAYGKVRRKPPYLEEYFLCSLLSPLSFILRALLIIRLRYSQTLSLSISRLEKIPRNFGNPLTKPKSQMSKLLIHHHHRLVISFRTSVRRCCFSPSILSRKTPRIVGTSLGPPSTPTAGDNVQSLKTMKKRTNCRVIDFAYEWLVCIVTECRASWAEQRVFLHIACTQKHWIWMCSI